MTDELITLLGGREIGRVRAGVRGKLTFAYDPAWREASDSYPLSLSMPLAAEKHGPAAIEALHHAINGPRHLHLLR